MAKKKMTPAQAASARRPDDWEPPQNSTKKKESRVNPNNVDIGRAMRESQTKQYLIPFLIVVVILGLGAPFIVTFLATTLGIASA